MEWCVAGLSGEPVPEPVVVCLGGMVSGLCSVGVEALLDDTVKLVDIVDAVWGEDPERPILFVAPSLRGFSGFLRSLGEMGRNPFLVEVTGVPETMLSGLSMDKLIEYYAGFIALTFGERRRASKRRPAVTRRELFRRLFLVTPEYVIQPRGLGAGCDDACPLGALRGGRVEESRCRGCMVCLHRCGASTLWAGAAAMAYAYRYVSEHGLDGVLFVCRERLDLLDEKAIEASPAKLLPVHLPCTGWLSPRLVAAMAGLGVYVHVLAGPGVCSGCPRWEPLASAGHLDALREAGAVVSEDLSPASSYAYTGYTRKRLDMEEVLRVLEEALAGEEP